MAWTERYVDPNATGLGTGTSTSDPWTLDQAVSSTTSGMRVNFKKGTYNVLSNINTAFSGAATDPIIWRGYDTTPGDLDGTITSNLTPGTDMPLISCSGVYVLLDSQYHEMIGLAFEQNDASLPILYDRRTYSYTKNCSFEHKSTAMAATYGVDGAGSYRIYVTCKFTVGGSSGSNTILEISEFCHVQDCVVYTLESTKTTAGIRLNGNNGTVTNTVIFGCEQGIYSAGKGLVCNQNTFWFCDTGIETNNSSYAGLTSITNCVFHSCSNHVVGNTSTSAMENPFVDNNLYYNSPTLFDTAGDLYDHNPLNDSSEPFVDTVAGDLSLVSTSNGYEVGTGRRGLFASTDYKSKGAIQHQSTSGGGGGGTTTISLHPLDA